MRTHASWRRRLAALLVFGLAACAARQPGSSEVEVLTDAGTVAAEELGRAVLVGPLTLRNSTASASAIEGASWRVVIEDPSGNIERQGELGLAISAPAGGAARGELRIEVDLPVSAAAFAARQAQTSLPWSLSATLKVKGATGLEEYEAEWNGKLYPPKAPELTVEAQAARSEGALELRFFVGVNNPNPFPVTVDTLTYDLKLLDIAVAAGELVRGRRMEAASGWELEIYRVIGRDDLKDLAKTLLKRSGFPYSIAAKMQVGDVSWDLPFAGEIKFD